MKPIRRTPTYLLLLYLCYQSTAFAFYNPAVGKWLNRDPAQHVPDYVFVLNNPPTYLDVNGLFAFDYTFHFNTPANDPVFAGFPKASGTTEAQYSFTPGITDAVDPKDPKCRIFNVGTFVQFHFYYKVGVDPYTQWVTSRTGNYQYLWEHEEHHATLTRLEMIAYEERFKDTKICCKPMCYPLYRDFIRSEWEVAKAQNAVANKQFDIDEYQDINDPRVRADLDARRSTWVQASRVALLAKAVFDACVAR